MSAPGSEGFEVDVMYGAGGLFTIDYSLLTIPFPALKKGRSLCPFLFRMYDCLVNPSKSAGDEAQHKKNEEDEEEDLSDRCCTGSDAAETENGCDDRNYQENDCPT